MDVLLGLELAWVPDGVCFLRVHLGSFGCWVFLYIFGVRKKISGFYYGFYRVMGG